METEAEALKRVNQPFIDLEKYSHAVAHGFVRGLLVVGDAGLGKSYGVEKVINHYRSIDNTGLNRYEIIKGTISSPVIYQKLYEYRRGGMVLVFDDCEIQDVDGLNLLKAALDSCDKREIAWYKESPWLAKSNLPKKFVFNGNIIQLTNEDLMATGGKRKDHMAAIISRCHYIDMRMKTNEDKIRRIKYVVYQSNMLGSYNLTANEIDDIVEYIISEPDNMRELSLRVVKKVADLHTAYPKEWRALADRGCKLDAK